MPFQNEQGRLALAEKIASFITDKTAFRDLISEYMVDYVYSGYTDYTRVKKLVEEYAATHGEDVALSPAELENVMRVHSYLFEAGVREAVLEINRVLESSSQAPPKLDKRREPEAPEPLLVNCPNCHGSMASFPASVEGGYACSGCGELRDRNMKDLVK